MRKFFLSGMIFTVGYCVLNIVFYFGITKPVLIDPYLKKPYEYRHYRNFIFSDSHGAVINQNILDPFDIYNFSYDSDSYADILLKIRFLTNSDVRIDTIYLSVGNHTLSPYREDYNNLKFSIFYSNQSYLPKSIPISQTEYLLSRYLKHYIPLTDINNSRLFYDYLKSRVVAVLGNVKSERHRNWNEIPPILRMEKIKTRIKEQFPTKNRSEVLTGTLQEIIDITIKNNIKLVGVKFPLSGELLSELNGMNYGADRVFQKNSILVFDFTREFSTFDDYFFDQDHLNSTGVSKLLKTLERQKVIVGKN